MEENIDTFHKMYTCICMGVWYTSAIVISENVIWYPFGTNGTRSTTSTLLQQVKYLYHPKKATATTQVADLL
jgi:hypothetical protein